MKKEKLDHIVTHQEGLEFHCLNCDQRYKPNLPCPMSIFLVIGKEFIRKHKDCKKLIK